jgi:hypothetical protein
LLFPLSQVEASGGFILLGGVLAMLAAGAITLAFKITKPEAAQQRAALAAPAKPIDQGQAESKQSTKCLLL